MRHDLRIGDEVEVTKPGYSKMPIGLKGKVVARSEKYGVCVEFAGWDGGHSAYSEGFEDPSESRWHFKNKDDGAIRKVKPEAKAKKAPKGKQAYKGNGKHLWEDVLAEGISYGYRTKRLRVPGGWLYRSDMDTASVFVPTPAVVGYAI